MLLSWSWSCVCSNGGLAICLEWQQLGLWALCCKFFSCILSYLPCSISLYHLWSNSINGLDHDWGACSQQKPKLVWFIFLHTSKLIRMKFDVCWNNWVWRSFHYIEVKGNNFCFLNVQNLFILECINFGCLWANFVQIMLMLACIWTFTYWFLSNLHDDGHNEVCIVIPAWMTLTIIQGLLGKHNLLHSFHLFIVFTNDLDEI